MIVFDIDGVLANVDHRKHFIDPDKNPKFPPCYGVKENGEVGFIRYENPFTEEIWKPDYEAYDAACDRDEPIKAVLDVFIHLTQGEPFNHNIQIWSGRCESVRDKTLKWLTNLSGYTEDIGYWDRRLKMRPLGNTEPACDLKERWMDEYFYSGEGSCPLRWANHEQCCKKIEMVFDADPESIAMWKRRGIFVFDCNQQK